MMVLINKLLLESLSPDRFIEKKILKQRKTLYFRMLARLLVAQW